MGGSLRVMEWWNNFVAWFYSDEGWRVVSTAVIPFLSILTAGIVAAVIARGSINRLLARQQRDTKAAAIAALVGAGRKTVGWNGLRPEERLRVDDLITQAEVQVRLLPMPGVGSVADWAAHQLASMKNDSATFTFQAEQTFVDFRDRLLEWQLKPGRARKLFAFDLEQWRHEGVDTALHENQRQWEASSAEDAPLYQPESTSQESYPQGAYQSELNEDDFEDGRTASVPLPPTADLATPPVVQAPQLQATVLTDQVPTAVFPEPADPFAPPVTAGTVRQRLAPETRDTL